MATIKLIPRALQALLALLALLQRAQPYSFFSTLGDYSSLVSQRSASVAKAPFFRTLAIKLFRQIHKKKTAIRRLSVATHDRSAEYKSDQITGIERYFMFEC